MQTDLLLVVIVKALAELAGMFLLGRGALYLLAGRKRDANLFYQIMCVVTDPLIKATRWITPRVIIDRHIPFVALVLLLWIWLGSIWLQAQMCSSGRADCIERLERRRD